MNPDGDSERQWCGRQGDWAGLDRDGDARDRGKRVGLWQNVHRCISFGFPYLSFILHSLRCRPSVLIRHLKCPGLNSAFRVR